MSRSCTYSRYTELVMAVRMAMVMHMIVLMDLLMIVLMGVA